MCSRGGLTRQRYSDAEIVAALDGPGVSPTFALLDNVSLFLDAGVYTKASKLADSAAGVTAASSGTGASDGAA